MATYSLLREVKTKHQPADIPEENMKITSEREEKVNVASEEEGKLKEVLEEEVKMKNKESSSVNSTKEEHGRKELIKEGKMLQKEKALENVYEVGGKENKTYKGQNKKKLCVADILGKDFMGQSTTNISHSISTHNDTYCREWVSKSNTVSQNVAQTEKSIIEQDTCDSELLNNVTSVSNVKWVKQKKKQVDTKVSNNDSNTV